MTKCCILVEIVFDCLPSEIQEQYPGDTETDFADRASYRFRREHLDPMIEAAQEGHGRASYSIRPQRGVRGLARLVDG